MTWPPVLRDHEVTAQTFLGHRDREQCRSLLENYVAVAAEFGWGMRSIRDRQTNLYLGEAGLVPTSFGGAGLRYSLGRAGWGRGYATEASVAVVDDAFARTSLDRLIAGVQPANAASLRVMEKLGFVHTHDVTDHGPPFRVFEITAENWSRRH